ncbi:MAG: hypothetical protein QOD91_333, partial [Frankiales bacterium]|nr:hypothetical protein [Frankiales bacterium]
MRDAYHEDLDAITDQLVEDGQRQVGCRRRDLGGRQDRG